jgi:hypothetical protein
MLQFAFLKIQEVFPMQENFQSVMVCFLFGNISSYILSGCRYFRGNSIYNADPMEHDSRVDLFAAIL